MSRRAIPRDMTGLSASTSLATSEIVWDQENKVLRVGDGAEFGGAEFRSMPPLGPVSWLEPLASQTETVSQMPVLSKTGKALAIIGASRTSDAVAPAYFSGIGVFGFGHNDRARGVDFDTTFAAWGGYFEARRDPGSGRTHGIEIGTVNVDDGTDPPTAPDPYHYGQNNQLSSLWSSAGRPDQGAGQRDIDVAAGFIQNGPSGLQVSYSVGLMFGENSVREVLNGDAMVAPVMRMPTRYQIEWWTTDGLQSYIRSAQTAAGALTGIVFQDSNIAFEYDGVETMLVTQDGLRTVAYNGGFDANALYVGASSVNATQQWQLQGGAQLYLNKNTGTHGSPTWSARGQFDSTTGAYTSVSDSRLKNDLGEFDRDVWETVTGLADAVRFYAMKDDEEQGAQLGFMAQDVAAALPEAVTGDEILMLSDRPILAVMALAMADLKSRIDELEATP